MPIIVTSVIVTGPSLRKTLVYLGGNTSSRTMRTVPKVRGAGKVQRIPYNATVKIIYNLWSYFCSFIANVSGSVVGSAVAGTNAASLCLFQPGVVHRRPDCGRAAAGESHPRQRHRQGKAVPGPAPRQVPGENQSQSQSRAVCTEQLCTQQKKVSWIDDLCRGNSSLSTIKASLFNELVLPCQQLTFRFDN